jgi:putative phosphoesterase
LLRLAVLSDIHGSTPALRAVLEDLDRQGGVAQLLVAGDYVGGPQPVETVRMLRGRDAWMILGNSDTSLLRYDSGLTPDFQRTSHQFALLRWAHRHVDRETLSFLRSLPEEGVFRMPGTAPIRLVHIAPVTLGASIYPQLDLAGVGLAMASIAAPVLVFGHSHQPLALARNGWLALNPGAVTGPLNGFVGAQYALLTWQGHCWEAELRGVHYDMGLARKEFQESGLLAEGGPLARSFLLSNETACNIAEDFLAYARLLAGRLGFPPGDPIPDEAWDWAGETFDWDIAAAGRMQYWREKG